MNHTSLWLSIKDKQLWIEWLNRLPITQNDIYAHPEYINLHTDQEKEPRCYIFSHDENIFLYPFLLQKTPFIDNYYDITTAYGYGGPLFSTCDRSFLELAYSCFYKKAKQNNIVAELIKFNPLQNNHAHLKKIFPGKIIPACKTVFVKIDQDEELRWTNEYTAANRKGIKKAIRNNITVEFDNSKKKWNNFEKLYAETMKFNIANKFYFFSPKYFEKIRNNLSSNYILSSATVNGTTGASMIILHGKKFAYCHLIGTNRSYQKIGINNYLHHQCIQWCKKEGIDKLLIGGGRTNQDDDSLLKFKMNFSKKMTSFYIGENILNKEIYNELCKLRDLYHSPSINDNILFKYRF